MLEIVILILVISISVAGVSLIVIASFFKKYEDKREKFYAVGGFFILNSIWLLARSLN